MTKFVLEIDDFKTIVCDYKEDVVSKIKELFDDFIGRLEVGPSEGFHVELPTINVMHLSERDCKRMLLPKAEFKNVFSFPDLKGVKNNHDNPKKD
jgi:hypothetical protein